MFRDRALSLLGAGIITLGSAIAQNGTLDMTFSGDGQLGFLPQIPDVITVDILETGGSIFPILSAVNGTSSSYILKLNEDGSFNGDFGTGGIFEFPHIGFYDGALAHDGNSILLLAGGMGTFRICALDLNGTVVVPWTNVFTPGGLGFAKMLVDQEGRICIGMGTTIDGAGHGMVDPVERGPHGGHHLRHQRRRLYNGGPVLLSAHGDR
ncbi:MAG: hypothetical protein QM724_01890 [Flavobacteriales bacterium]